MVGVNVIVGVWVGNTVGVAVTVEEGVLVGRGEGIKVADGLGNGESLASGVGVETMAGEILTGRLHASTERKRNKIPRVIFIFMVYKRCLYHLYSSVST